MKKAYTERKFKKEYLSIKDNLNELIDTHHSYQYISPKGSTLVINSLELAIQTIEEDFRYYELKLMQLASLIHLLEKEENGFNGELYNISHHIIHKTGHYNDWKKYSLLIEDNYPVFQ